MAVSSPLTASSATPQQYAQLLSSPSTLPLDLTSPVRIVQKQVLHVRGHARGCTVALFMRLALPMSSKTRSFQLFSDEGVKIKSSAVYPVTMSKGGRTTVIPSDSSSGLKRAVRVLGLETAVRAVMHDGEDDRAVDSASYTGHTKQIKPRITSANFHVTLVCPPLREEREEITEGCTPASKSHFVAVIQIEVGLSLSPPRWPFEARIPIPRCLNNKLLFVADDTSVFKDQNGQSESFTVEFNPSLVQRPPPRSRKSEGPVDEPRIDQLDVDGNSGGANDDANEGFAVSGPFPSSDIMVARWAIAHAGVIQTLESAANVAGRHPVRASMLRSEAQILHVEAMEDEYHGNVRVSLRVHLSLGGFHYPGLDQTAALYLALEGGAHWLPDTLSVCSERAKLLDAWSAEGREESLLSQSSCSRTSTPKPDSASITRLPSFDNEGASLLFDSMLNDDSSNLIDTQPPKGVADVSNDSISIGIHADDAPVAPPSLLTPPRLVRRPSIGSMQSISSEYSQKSAISEPGPLCLLLRTSSLRDAAHECDELRFSVQGQVRMQAAAQVGGVGSLRLVCPSLVATHIPTQASLCSVSDEVIILSKATGKQLVQPVDTRRPIDTSSDESGFEVVRVALPDGGDHPSHDQTFDNSTNTATPIRQTPVDDRSLLRESNGSSGLLDIASIALHPPVEDQVAQWMGVVEEASVKVWKSEAVSPSGKPRRKLVSRLRMTWPRAWPGIQSTTADGKGESRVNLLPTLVVTVPRLPDQERVDFLHASIQGEPLNMVNESTEVDEYAATSEGLSSTSLRVRLPVGLPVVNGGDIYVTLVYSVEGGEESTPQCMFAPIASAVGYLEVELFDDAIKNDVVPIVGFSEEPSASSVRVDQQNGTASVMISMLPSMSKVTFEYAPQTKPLVPLAAMPRAPLRRQSTGLAVAASTSDSLTVGAKSPAIPMSKLHLWSPLPRLASSTLVHMALTVALAMLLLYISLTALPTVQLMSHKMDRIAAVLDVEVDDATPWRDVLHSYRWSKSRNNKVHTGYDDERSLVVKQHADIAAASLAPSLLRVAATWLSLVVTWPVRMALRIWH